MSLNHRRLRSGGKYGYYRSNQNDLGRRQRLAFVRARAVPLERLVVSSLSALLKDRARVRAWLLRLGYYDASLDKLADRSDAAAVRLGRLDRRELRHVLRALIARIEVSPEIVRIVVRWTEVARFVDWHGVGSFGGDEESWHRNDKCELIEVPAGDARCHRKLCLPIEPRREPQSTPSPGLLRLIEEARHAQALVDENREVPLRELARRMHVRGDRFARVLRLNYLAPDIVTGILDGHHPSDLTSAKLIKANLPLDWALQRQFLGFPPQTSSDGY